MRGGAQDAGWISAWKTPKGVTPPEFAAHYEELSAEDTFHDMWDPRGAASPMKVQGATDAMRRVQVKSANLNNKWLALEREDAVTVAAKAKEMALGENPGASDYERSLVIKWESTLPSYLHSASRKLLTYDEIIADWNGPKALWQKYTTSFVAGNILEINNAPGKTFKMLDQKQRAIVANFMLSYLWPTGRPVQGNQYNVTFDAGPVVIRRLLDSIEVKNLITPQNVADSAATGFNAMKTTTYAFPNTGRVKSNTFTGPYVEIKYVNNGFGPLNPYGFSIVLDFKAIPRTAARPFNHTLQFSPKQNSGPSVNYLVTSILRVDGSLPNYKGPIQPSDREKSTIIDIAPLVAALVANGYPPWFIQALLLDLKRIGDHEQIAAALTVPNTLFATIDILCCFMARFVRTPNAWSNNDSAEIWLHRFDTTDLNYVQQFLRDQVAFAQEQLARIKMLYKIIPTGEHGQGLDGAIRDFTTNASKVYYVTMSRWSSKLDPNIRMAISSPSSVFPENQSDIIPDQRIQAYLTNSLTTHLLRFKLWDANQYASTLSTQVDTVRRALVPIGISTQENVVSVANMFNELSTLSYMSPLEGTPFALRHQPPLPSTDSKLILSYRPPPTPVNVTGTITAIKTAFQTTKELIGLCLTDKDIYPDNLFEGDTPQLRRGANNQTFGISKDMIDNFNSAFREFFGLLHPVRAPTRSDYGKKVDESLDKFFKKRDVILKSLSNTELAARLESVIDIPNNLTVEQKRAASLVMIDNLQKAALQMRLASDGSGEPLAEPVSGGGQRGGANAIQYLDRADLFLEICGLAASYVESTITNAINGRYVATQVAAGVHAPVLATDAQLVATEITMPMADKIAILSADSGALIDQVSDIAYHWEKGIFDIRENAKEYYGEVYEEADSDFYINALVSATSVRGADGILSVESQTFLDVGPIDRRSVPGIEDLAAQLLTSPIPIEIRTLILLTVLDNLFRRNKQYRYFTEGYFTEAPDITGKDAWDNLGDIIKTLLVGINHGTTVIVPAVAKLFGIRRGRQTATGPVEVEPTEGEVATTNEFLRRSLRLQALKARVDEQVAAAAAAAAARTGPAFNLRPRGSGRKTRRRGLPKLV